jgi:lysine-ketoglutarate reductase/saccharopine dehydrogenase-like protein (TIGR00300 family)
MHTEVPSFKLPEYIVPDFGKPPFSEAPLARFEEVEREGVAPQDYHATSIYPEYFHVRKGEWVLPIQSRMDCVAVAGADGTIDVREFRRLKPGDLVACGRRENGEDGIFVYTDPFGLEFSEPEKFAFRTGISRETSFSNDYDELYNLLEYESKYGYLLWVLGPAAAFDKDSRDALSALIDHGFVHGVLAGNALATHDIEADLFGTALGQDIYTKKHARLGHYNHLDAINTIRRVGSIEAAVEKGIVKGGIMDSIVRCGVPFVLAGSIRDDGPMPEVIADSCEAQDAMRRLVRKATTIIATATQLHSIAVGNMTPSYTVMEDDTIRPVYFYTVDMSEFAINKLVDRGSLTARSILTNTQDFLVNLRRRLVQEGGCKAKKEG